MGVVIPSVTIPRPDLSPGDSTKVKKKKQIYLGFNKLKMKSKKKNCHRYQHEP